MQNQENVFRALEQARGGDYDTIRGYLIDDSKKTSFHIAEAYADHPELDLRSDTSEGGFLENLAQNAFSGHPQEVEAKEYLAGMLSAVPPRNIIGKTESGMYITTFFLTKLILLPDKYSFRLCDCVTDTIFGVRKRENQYRSALHLQPIYSKEHK